MQGARGKEGGGANHSRRGCCTPRPEAPPESVSNYARRALPGRGAAGRGRGPHLHITSVTDGMAPRRATTRTAISASRGNRGEHEGGGRPPFGRYEPQTPRWPGWAAAEGLRHPSQPSRPTRAPDEVPLPPCPSRPAGRHCCTYAALRGQHCAGNLSRCPRPPYRRAAGLTPCSSYAPPPPRSLLCSPRLRRRGAATAPRWCDYESFHSIISRGRPQRSWVWLIRPPARRGDRSSQGHLSFALASIIPISLDAVSAPAVGALRTASLCIALRVLRGAKTANQLPERSRWLCDCSFPFASSSVIACFLDGGPLKV